MDDLVKGSGPVSGYYLGKYKDGTTLFKVSGMVTTIASPKLKVLQWEDYTSHCEIHRSEHNVGSDVARRLRCIGLPPTQCLGQHRCRRGSGGNRGGVISELDQRLVTGVARRRRSRHGQE
jgi:hypothetical protein